eukprot:TRINITY_DN3934_c2_g1_i1.p1 TRINITY_DN3934_c2_g1~~TRINITY_DN3934_c2_g1_i1.p1  ORF type:complete len:1103 (+),score=234.63 TRINITY_DN3934_c2_g1_i1:130-3438(+)
MADTHGAGDCVDDRASRSGSGAASGEMTRSAALRSPSGSPKSASGGETHSEPASFGDGVHDEDSAAKERAGKAGQAQHGPGDEKEKEKECDGGTTVPMAKFIAQRTLQEKWREKAAHGAKEQAVMAVTVGQLQKELHEARRRVDSERDTLLVEQVTTLEKQLAQLSREIREQLAADGATSTQLASRLKRAFPQSTARAHGRQSQGLAVAVDHGSKESQNSTPSPTPPITPSNRPSSRHSLATNHGVERERAMEEHQGTPGPPGSTSPRDLLFEPFCLKCFREVNAREKHVPLPARATQKLTSESLLLKLLLLSRKQAEDAEATRLAQKQRIVECDSHIARLHTLILKLQQELKRVASGAAAPSTGVTISDLGDITASLSYMKYSLLGLKGSVSSVQQFITDAVLRADRAVGALGGLNAGYDAVIATLQGVGPKLCAGLTRLHDGHKQKDRLPEAPDVPGVGDLGGWQTSHLRSMQRLAVWVEEYAGVNELIAKEEEAAAKVAAAAAAAAGLSCAAAGLERTAVDVLAVGAAGCLCLLSLYECAHRMHKACSAPVRFVDARLWKAPAAVEEDVENSDELLQTKLGDSLRSGLAASDALAAPVTPGGTSRGGTSRGSLAERRRLPSHPPRLRTDSITVDSFCATLQGAPAADESASGGSRRDASYATPTLQEGSFRWADANPLRGKQKDASGRLHPPSARGTPSKATPLLSVAGAAPDGSFNSVLDGNTALALPVRDKCVRNNSSSDPEGLKGPRGSPHLLRSGAVRRSALSVVGRPEDEVPKFAGTASFASPPASPPRRATIAINATNAVAAAGGLVDAPKTPLVERRQRTLVGFSPHPNADTATVSPPIPVRTDSGGPLLGYPEKPLLSASIAMQRPRAKPEDSSAAASSSRRLVGPLLPDSPTFPTATSPPDNLSALSSPKYGRQLRGRSDAALALALSGRGSAAFAGSPVSQFSASSPTDEHCSASMMQTTSNLGTTRRVSGDSVPMAATPPAVDAALPLGPLASPRGRKQALVNAAALEMIPDLGATLRKISQAPSSLSASSPRGADSAASSPRRRAPDACTGGSVLASPRTSLRSLRGLGKTSSAKAIVSGALAPTAL